MRFPVERAPVLPQREISYADWFYHSAFGYPLPSRPTKALNSTPEMAARLAAATCGERQATPPRPEASSE